MRFLLVLGLFFGGWGLPRAVLADCACFCVDGAAKTLCTAVEEAQASADACGARASQVCPVNLDPLEPQAYPAPADGAVNCRDVQVFDGAAGQHTSLKVCDVQPSA